MWEKLNSLLTLDWLNDHWMLWIMTLKHIWQKWFSYKIKVTSRNVKAFSHLFTKIFSLSESLWHTWIFKYGHGCHLNRSLPTFTNMICMLIMKTARKKEQCFNLSYQQLLYNVNKCFISTSAHENCCLTLTTFIATAFPDGRGDTL